MAAAHVRALRQEDIPQVSRLHWQVFGLDRSWSPELELAYQQYLNDVFLGYPWYTDTKGSLVCEDPSGKITGFLGVMFRPMWMDGHVIWAAISSQFVVEPQSRSHLPGVALLKTFLSGPQDLSLADEANDSSRIIWEHLGGATALPLSWHWTAVLRPARFVRLRLEGRGFSRPLGLLSAPLCPPIDAIAARLPLSPFRPLPSPCSAEDLSAATLLNCFEQFLRSRRVRPKYDLHSLSWLLSRCTGSQGRLRKCIVMSASGQRIGCFLYQIGSQGVGEVLHIASEPASAEFVLKHLFHDAWKEDVVVLNGRSDFAISRAWDHPAMRHRRRYWMLVHSRSPALVQAVCSGAAAVSRLDGEWCMRFQAPPGHN